MGIGPVGGSDPRGGSGRRARNRADESLPTRVLPLALPRRAARALPEPRPALERPAEVHLHLHGVSPADTPPSSLGARTDQPDPLR